METGKKKTGIMGGTFNPVHNGHLLLAESAREAFGLDEILFIPSGHSYMKSGIKIADKETRLEMTRLAIADNPYFSLSSIETRREGDSYTYETLQLLHAKKPDVKFYFIVGADSLFHMETWKQPETIFHSCTVLAAVRNGAGNAALNGQIAYLAEKYGAEIGLVPMKEFAVSSTDIRSRISQGKSIRYMVPDKVIAYIKEHGLYLEQEPETSK